MPSPIPTSTLCLLRETAWEERTDYNQGLSIHLEIQNLGNPLSFLLHLLSCGSLGFKLLVLI